MSVPRRPRGGGGMQRGAQSGALCRPPGNGPRLPPDRAYMDPPPPHRAKHCFTVRAGDPERQPQRARRTPGGAFAPW